MDEACMELFIHVNPSNRPISSSSRLNQTEVEYNQPNIPYSVYNYVWKNV
jgi:hypothetical protein